VTEFGFNGTRTRVEQLALRHDDHVVSWSDLVSTENLSNQSFGSISLDRATQLARRRDAQASLGTMPGEREDREVPAVRPRPALVDELKLGAPMYSLVRPEASHVHGSTAGRSGPIRC
jgi:hypothetical protein